MCPTICDYCPEEDREHHETFFICCPDADKACFQCINTVINSSTTCPKCERQMGKKISKLKSDARRQLQMIDSQPKQRSMNRTNSSGNLGIAPQMMQSSFMHQSNNPNRNGQYPMNNPMNNSRNSQMINQMNQMSYQRQQFNHPYNYQNRNNFSQQQYSFNSPRNHAPCYMNQFECEGYQDYPNNRYYPPNYQGHYQYNQSQMPMQMLNPQPKSFNKPYNQSFDQPKRNFTPEYYQRVLENMIKMANRGVETTNVMDDDFQDDQEEEHIGNFCHGTYIYSKQQPHTTDSLLPQNQYPQSKMNRSTSVSQLLKRKEF